MISLRLHQPGVLRVHEEPDPIPAPDEVLLSPRAVGLCGSDLHWYEHGGTGTARLSRPLVLGHEVAGVIAEGPERGQPVVLDPSAACESCEPCRSGDTNFCRRQRFAGHDQEDGGLRTLMAWPRRFLKPVPDSMDLDEAALLEPLAVALHAIELGEFKTGMAAGVFGSGPIGLLIIRALRASGASRIVATDRSPLRAQAARASGADLALTVEAARPAPLEDAARGLDVTFEVAGDDEALDAAVGAAKPRGLVVVVGIPASERTSVHAALARTKGITLTWTRRAKGRHIDQAIDAVAMGRIDVSGLVTRTFELEAGELAFRELRARSGLKLVVHPSG